MTDDPIRGLGALPDSPDPRDYPIDALYLAEDAEPFPLDALPSTFWVSAPRTPILDQGTSPMCVAYSTAWQKAYADRRDYLTWFDFAEAVFFHQIGGTEQGAEVRWAMQRLVDVGYPVTNVANSAGQHRIAAYYWVHAGPGMFDAIRQALVTFGVPLVLSTAWFRSWFKPKSDGTLPPPDTQVGGHAIVIAGYTPDALWLANSWGTDWGEQGYCKLPKAYLSHARAAVRAVDVVDHPVPYVRRVVTKTRVNLRKGPRTSAAKIGSIPEGATLLTKQLEKYGGRYTGPQGAVRTDWVQVTRGDHTGWVARGYTRPKA